MPIVPPEIIEAIVSQVAVEDLPACALASKLLLPFARQRMYRSIQISFLVWHPESDWIDRDVELSDYQIVQPYSQVLLHATLQRCPHLGSLVREITAGNENLGRGKSLVHKTENTFTECLRACPHVDSITYRGSMWAHPAEADAIVRVILAVKPPLREFTILGLESDLAQEFFLVYPHIKSLGILAARRDYGETFRAGAAAVCWPAELTKLKVVVISGSIRDDISRVFRNVSTKSCRTITSLHLSYLSRGPPPVDPPDLSPLTALSTLTLEGLIIPEVERLLSKCMNLKHLRYQVEDIIDDPSMTATRTTVYSTPSAEVGTDEMVAACHVAKGVVVRRKDWGRND